MMRYAAGLDMYEMQITATVRSVRPGTEAEVIPRQLRSGETRRGGLPCRKRDGFRLA